MYMCSYNNIIYVSIYDIYVYTHMYICMYVYMHIYYIYNLILYITLNIYFNNRFIINMYT